MEFRRPSARCVLLACPIFILICVTVISKKWTSLPRIIEIAALWMLGAIRLPRPVSEHAHPKRPNNLAPGAIRLPRPVSEHAHPKRPNNLAASGSSLSGHARPLDTCSRVSVNRRPTHVNKAGQAFLVNGAHWFWRDYAGWEPGTFEVFKRFAVNKVVLDIGAWIGATTLWLAQVATVVVALEPTVAAFRELCRNIAANQEIAGRVVPIHAAMDSMDRTIRISNRGDSMDRFLQMINARAVSIGSLRKEQPVLEDVGFVKIDTEGYERVLIGALRDFFIEKKPMVYLSLHPMYISHAHVQRVVDELRDIFPFLYEQDMHTPFKNRQSYTGGDHGGTDVVCSWQALT